MDFVQFLPESSNFGCGTTSRSSSSDTHPNTALYGTWKGACSAGIAYWYSFYKDSAVMWEIHFTNAGCCGSPRYYIERNGPHSVSGNHVDSSYTNYIVHPIDSTTTANFHSVSLCGTSNWSVDTDTAVNGTTCDFSALGLGSAVTFASGIVPDYDIFNISGSTLRFGDRGTGIGTTSMNRPTTLDTVDPFALDPTILIIPNWAL